MKGGPDVFTRCDGFEEIAGFDDDLVLIAGAVAGAEAKWLVVLVQRPGQDFREALAVGLCVTLIQPQGILILLIKANGALGAEG